MLLYVVHDRGKLVDRNWQYSSLDFEKIRRDHSDDDGRGRRGGLHEHGRQHAEHYPHYGILGNG